MVVIIIRVTYIHVCEFIVILVTCMIYIIESMWSYVWWSDSHAC